MRVLWVLLVLAGVMAAQPQKKPVDKSKRPSPPGSARCAFADGNAITIDYSRPFMRGRKIYGGLVPYDQVWRTGANEATTFVTTTDLNLGGATVSKGEYTLFTLPSSGTWKLIISKKTGEWGIPYPGEQFDLARVDMKASPLEQPVEQFTISFDSDGKSTCALHLDWEKTRESIQVSEK